MKERWIAAGFQALYATALIVGATLAVRIVMLVIGRTPQPVQPWLVLIVFGMLVIGGFLRPSSSLPTRSLVARLRGRKSTDG